MACDLDELERLERAATPGPWIYHPHLGSVEREFTRAELAVGVTYDNGKFIAAARNALPALIRELKAARKVVKMADNATRFFDEDYPSYVGPLRGALADYETAVTGCDHAERCDHTGIGLPTKQ